jgi:hypothetical protein
MQKQYEIVAIYLYLFTDFVRWDNWTIFWKFDACSTLIWINLKMLSWFECNLEFEKVWWFDIQKIDYLNCSIIQFDVMQKNAELKLKFSSNNWISLFNSVIWIDFVKMNYLNKVNLHKYSITETFSSIDIERTCVRWYISMNLQHHGFTRLSYYF